MDTLKKQVIIVGAGLSGLIAARSLLAHNLSVQILEASDRIGGRIVDFTSISGHVFSLGGDWFGTGEHKFNQLLADLGLSARPVPPPQGKTIVRLMGQTHVCADEQGQWFPPIAIPADLVSPELTQAFEKIATLAQQVTSAEAQPVWSEWDKLTLATWSQQAIQDEGQRKLFEMVVKEETGQELRAVSLLYYLFVYQSTVKRLEDDHVVVGGPQQLIEKLAQPLLPYLTTNAPVIKINQQANRVEVTTPDETYFADYVVLAISPAVANNIEYLPALPAKKQALYEAMQMGHIIKCVITYPSPFWYQQGLSGFILSDEGPLECTLDCGFQAKCGALIGYMMGDEAKKWSLCSSEQRKQAVVEQLAGFFGAEARQPLEYRDINWPKTPWIEGAYYASMKPGTMVAYGETLAEPFGRIFMAGTETAEDWCGTMEGAILAGERAATEVLSQINPQVND